MFSGILILFSTVSCTGNNASKGNILFEDDFSDRDSGWPESINDDGTMGYHEDGFRFLVTTSNYDLIATSGGSYTDVSIEVEAVKIGGADDNDFGIICRAEGLESFYAALITSNGRYGIFISIGGSDLKLIDMDQMMPSDAINQGNATNNIRLDCIADTISLNINGKLVKQVIDKFITSGDIGLIAGTYSTPGTDILFDNLIVTEPESTP